MLLAPDLMSSLLVFLGGFCAVVAADSLLVDMRRHVKRSDASKARERQAERNRQRVNEAISVGELSQIATVSRTTSPRPGVRERLQRIIDQADGATTQSRFWLVTVTTAVAGGAATFLWSGNALFTIGAVCVCALFPFAILVRLQHKRQEALLLQLSDTFGLMSRVMRCGQSVSQAMQAVAEEMEPPVSQEFLYCSERIRLGMDPGAALQQMANRTGLTELRIFVLAVSVHRACGGNLVTLIDLLEHLVRERFRIRGLVTTATAQGRTQSVVLVSMPVIVFVGLWTTNPDQLTKLFEHQWMIWTAAGLTFLGYLWVQWICKIEL